MKIIRLFIILLTVLTTTTLFANNDLMIFCGAAFKNPMDEVIQLFQNKFNIKVNAIYSGMGAVYSQLLFSKRGDLFIVPSPDMMRKAENNKVVLPDTIESFAYIVPVINVQKGNPKKITKLEDLARPGIRIAIGNPRTVFIGMLAVEIIEKGLTKEKNDLLKNNIVAYADSFSKLATFLLLRQVDVIVGFHYLSEWFPEKIDAVKLKPSEIQRSGCGQAAVTTYSKNVQMSQEFINFILSAEGKKIFNKYHYFNTKKNADVFIGKPKPVGGVYNIPQKWIK